MPRRPDDRLPIHPSKLHDGARKDPRQKSKETDVRRRFGGKIYGAHAGPRIQQDRAAWNPAAVDHPSVHCDAEGHREEVRRETRRHPQTDTS
jgi:hypothetical protein